LTWGDIHTYRNAHLFNVSEGPWKYQEILMSFCNKREVDYGAFFQMPGKASTLHHEIQKRRNILSCDG
jgi:phosphatidate phosphatase APP1